MFLVRCRSEYHVGSRTKHSTMYGYSWEEALTEHYEKRMEMTISVLKRLWMGPSAGKEGAPWPSCNTSMDAKGVLQTATSNRTVLQFTILCAWTLCAATGLSQPCPKETMTAGRYLAPTRQESWQRNHSGGCMVVCLSLWSLYVCTRKRSSWLGLLLTNHGRRHTRHELAGPR